MSYPKTLQQAIKHFSDEQTCIDAVAEMRWPDGKIVCEGCGEIDNTIWLANQKRWKCRGCKKQFSVKQGTIFHDSPLGLDKWFVAMWMLANCRNGVSSHELGRTIGVTQKSAWHMLARIRKAMEDNDNSPMTGVIEMDETFHGGKAKNMHAKDRVRKIATPNKGKQIVVGMLQRGGKVRAGIVEERSIAALVAMAHANAAPDATLITDELHAYKSVNLTHEIINHAEQYVRGHIHTNGIESFWSMLKRTIGGTYVAVEPFHLYRYLHEQVFRYNHRKDMDDAGRFKSVLKDIVGRQVTYAELTGRVGATA
jgi:transposase-like protein